MNSDSRLAAVAAAVGTPAFVYDAAVIRENYRTLAGALAGIPHRLHFSVKSNSNGSVLKLLAGLGAGADIVSAGELYRCLRAGFKAGDVVFSGVGKTDAELRYALGEGVGLINVESPGELDALIRLADDPGRPVPFGVRVNPDVTSDAHPYTSTGHGAAKFGVSVDELPELVSRAAATRTLRLSSVGAHIGSQITTVDPYLTAVKKVVAIALELRRSGCETLESVDIGGGFGIGYAGRSGLDVAALFARLAPLLAESGLRVLLEPGRSIVGTAGVLLTRVIYTKRAGGHNFAITDAAMNDLLRPSLYRAEHGVVVIEPAANPSAERTWDLVGPICESGDFLALGRELDGVGPGALVGIAEAGAYGFSMGSTYNSRPRPPEVMMDGDRWAVIRERDRPEDLTAREVVNPGWSSF